MSKTIDHFFYQKKSTSELPSSSNSFLKQKLLEKSQECEKAKKTTENIGGISEELLQNKLNKANQTIKELKEIVAKQKNDIKLLKYSLNAANRLCVSKDLNIERLIKEKNSQTQEQTIQKTIFSSFEGKIDSIVLKDLRTVPNGQSYDSTFVLKLIRHLYGNDLSVLLTRSVSGKNKSAITPTKRKIVQDILRERIVIEERDETRAELRTNRVGTLIHDAINNIVRPLKSQSKNSTSTITSANTNTNATKRIILEPPPLAPIIKKPKLF